MIEGEYLLWYDGSDRTLEEKIKPAARRHKQKFGLEPNVVYVHRSEELVQVGKIWVRPWPTVLKNHLLIGMEPKEE